MNKFNENLIPSILEQSVLVESFNILEDEKVIIIKYIDCKELYFIDINDCKELSDLKILIGDTFEKTKSILKSLQKIRKFPKEEYQLLEDFINNDIRFVNSLLIKDFNLLIFKLEFNGFVFKRELINLNSFVSFESLILTLNNYYDSEIPF